MGDDKGAKISRWVKPVVTEEEKKSTAGLDRVAECWNGVVDGLIMARGNWEEMQKLLLEIPRDVLQNAPIPVQKATLRFKKATFNVMLGRFSDYYRAFGGLEAMKVKGAEKNG